MVKQKYKTILDKIKCPQCGKLIPVTEAFRHQLTEQVKKEFEEKAIKQQQEFVVREKKVAEREKDIEKQIQKRIVQERTKIEGEAQKKAKESFAIEMEDLQAENREQKEKLRKAQETELVLRKRTREVEEREKNLELEIERKISDERKKIEEEVIKKTIEDHRFKDLEKDKKISDLLTKIEELKRQAEQGSQQTQGEVFELELEDFLKTQFSLDDIKPVPKGTKGADVLHHVYSNSGHHCGTIIWESKRTKNWIEGWIDKLKNDQREAKANIAVLVSDVLPKDVNGFTFRENIWITNYQSIFGLAIALRINLTQVAMTKLATVGKNEKIEVIFNYLTGLEFRQRVEAIVEAFTAMKGDLEKEKRVYTRQWAQREKQIERVITNTVGMYGDLQGLIGSSMQSIPALESGDEKTTEVENKKTENEEDSEVNIKDIPF
ncbi:DUF2130 domain-containing protein [bacterium (Candidatus Gribaldobacteria) CG_4_10_14_0_2_um_filter_36_18]|uniref:DUF2130 domain-containing protein n=2 Tax=Bacteria candidate phyla TaxID=1783234 RepID=A0A2M7VKG8_9BACT|nr:MAG: DUF2130 domain-containing protein [bacterium (Candidatus Gribaldobacteria) CG_4_10_14_0_2_um_filter_36_18]